MERSLFSKTKAMKTYVLMLSRAFMVGHPKDGLPTEFEDAVKEGRKIHTIRCNFPFWDKRIKEIQNGEAKLSIRQWIGKPYRSKQREIAQLTAQDGIGIQRAVITRYEWDENNMRKFRYWICAEGKEIELDDIARNDGFFHTTDFLSWFNPAINKQDSDEEGWRHLELAIIHFSPFRYYEQD